MGVRDELKLIVRFLEQNGYSPVRVDSPYGGDFQYKHPDGRQVACSFTERNIDQSMWGYHPSVFKCTEWDDKARWGWNSIRGMIYRECDVIEYLLSHRMGK